jgi:hypothetical protein
VKQKAASFSRQLLFSSDDPKGIRTPVAAVRGRCLNRLTMGPQRRDIIILPLFLPQVNNLYNNSGVLTLLSAVLGRWTKKAEQDQTYL